MKKNGFTLVELLAILIILSLIAIITIPVVFNMIDSSKKGTVRDSAYGYISSIQKMYYSNQLDDSIFEFEDRGYTVSELKSLGISFDGQEPIGDSWILFSNNDIVRACLQFDDYRVDIRGEEVTRVIKGECDRYIKFNGKYVEAGEGDTHKGIVYLDPTNLSNTCDETNYDSTLGNKSGCMQFYVFKEYENNGDSYVEMILDHNTTLSFPYNGSNGCDSTPREALYQLYEDTKDWNDIKFLKSDSNYYASWQTGKYSYSYMIDYTKHPVIVDGDYVFEDGAFRARLISIEDIIKMFDDEYVFSLSNIPRFYFGSFPNQIEYRNQTSVQKNRQRSYSWLFDNLWNCQNHGCVNGSLVGGTDSSYTESVGNYGYWTSSRCSYVHFSGGIGSTTSDNHLFGIRPVITIPKYVLGID